MVLALLMTLLIEAEPPPPELKALVAQARLAAMPHQDLHRFPQEWGPNAAAIVEYGEQAIPLVMPLLKHPSPGVRVFFGYVVARLPGLTPREFAPLRDAYQGGNGWVMAAIASIDSPAVHEFLLEDFLRNPGASGAGFFLKRIGEPAVLPLVRALRTRTRVSRYFGDDACALFMSIGEAGRKVSPELLAILKDERLPMMNRLTALRLIECGASATDATRSSVDEIVKASKSLASDQEIAKIQRALGTPDAITRTLERLAEHPEEVRYLAAGGQSARKAEPEVLRLLAHEDADVRLAAIEVLGALGGEAATIRLEALLTDPRDWRAPCAAARALAQLKAVRSKEAIQAAERIAWLPATAKCISGASHALESDQAMEPKPFRWWQLPRGNKLAAGPVQTRGPAELDERALKKLSVTGAIHALSEKGPFTRNVSAAPSVGLSIDGGVLAGTDRGEWGGELVLLTPNQKQQMLLEKNIVGIHVLGSEIVIVTGLAHLIVEGALYRALAGPDGILRASEWRVLPGAPEKSFVLPDGRLFVGCTGADIVVDETGTISLATEALVH